MSIPTAESRFSSEGTPMVKPTCTSSPSSTAKDGQGFSKAGRRVLAELACNDSPVIGLFPPGTPASCKKSSSGGPVRSRRALLSNLPSHPGSTPLGESLLRSQVQLLLQKVESDMCASHPCLRESAHPSVKNGFMVSPTMLAAPTPLNTPAALAPAMQDMQPIFEAGVESARMDETLVQSASAEESISLHGDSQGTVGFLDAHVVSREQPALQDGLHIEEQNALSASGSFVTFVSTTMCQDMKPLQPTPLLSEASDVCSPSEIFAGKRVLHFDDDTPCKPSPTRQFDTTSFDESGSHSLVRELDDDELSEWSVHVNVGSPADKQSAMEQAEHVVLAENGFSSSIHEHVKKIQQKSSNKVDLLWQKGRGRREDAHYEEEEEEENAEDPEQYYSGNEEEMGYDEEEGECDNLCDMLKEMRFEETESKRLPRGEGKHTRFLYGEEEEEDDIVVSMVVKGEEEVAHGCTTATRLNGLPAPVGRHWRFEQEDDEEEEEESSSSH